MSINDIGKCRLQRTIRKLPRTKVVYILGTGRSGSTALGIALGNLESVFYAGELYAWAHFRGVTSSRNAETIEFWQRIRDSVPRSSEYLEFDFYRHLEHHSALFRIRQLFDKNLLRTFEECSSDLFSAIATSSRCKFIVDSSHYPLRLLRLRRVRDLDLKVILLVRDPRAVIRSLQPKTHRSKPMGPLRANIYHLVVSILSFAVFWTFGPSKRIKIRYEDFASQPLRAIEKLSQFLDVSNNLTDLCCLSTHNIFHGNRVIHNASITIQPHRAPETLSKPWRYLTAIIQFPFLAIHKYL